MLYFALSTSSGHSAQNLQQMWAAVALLLLTVKSNSWLARPHQWTATPYTHTTSQLHVEKHGSYYNTVNYQVLKQIKAGIVTFWTASIAVLVDLFRSDITAGLYCIFKDQQCIQLHSLWFAQQTEWAEGAQLSVTSQNFVVLSPRTRIQM